MSTTKTVNVTTGKVLNYTIKKQGYKTISGSKFIDQDETININMIPESSQNNVYVFGDRIGGCATFYTYFDSINPDTNVAQKYAVFVLDAYYRRATTKWSANGTDTPLPNYTSIENVLAAKESATYNTQLIFDTYSPTSSSYDAFYYARNPNGQALLINVDGVNYAPQLPNIYELNVMYPYKDQLDALDPTLADGTGSIHLFVNYQRPWSSNEYNGTSAWRFYTDNSTKVTTAQKNTTNNQYIYPVFEIPVN